MTVKEKLDRLNELLEEIEAYGHAIGKMNFDMECVAPPDGIERAGIDMVILGKHVHELTHSEEYESLVCELYAERDSLEFPVNKLIEHLYDYYVKEKNISADLSYRLDLAGNEGYEKWLAAKKADDFSIFRDAFEKVVHRVSVSRNKSEETYK